MDKKAATLKHLDSAIAVLKQFTADVAKAASDAIKSLTAEDVGALTEIKIGTVTTGAAGSKASASAATSGTVSTLNLTIPKGDKGDPGTNGTNGAKGATGTRGSRWNTGTAITGTSTTATVFSDSGITDALVNDMYLNTSTGAVYECTTAGAAAAAKWVYVGSIMGATANNAVTQTNTTTKAAYRVLFSKSANDTNETDDVRKSVNLQFNPSTGALYSLGYDRIDISGQTVDLNTYTLSAGHPQMQHLINRNNGGAANIANLPVAGLPFVIDVELIRWASASDYVTRQTFRNYNSEYERTCTSGTWSAWTQHKFTDTNTTYSAMTAATSSAAGKAGLVPAPAAGAQNKFLRGDGTWQSLVSAGTVSIPITGWKKDSTAIFPNYYDVAISGILAADRVDLIVDIASLDTALKCGLCGITEALAGKVRIRSRTVPSAAISLQYWIMKQ